MNVDEFLEMDPYEEVAQQWQLHPLSPAYVPDPIELDEHVPVHVPEPKHPEYHQPSDDDIQVEDDDKDLEEDPSEEIELEDDDEDPEEDPNEEQEPEDETEPFEEDETAVTPPPPRHREVRISVRPQTPMAASTQALIDAFVAGSSLFPLPPTSHAYDQAPLGHRTAMIRRRDDIPEEDMPPRMRFAFTTPPLGCDVAESSAAARAPRGQYDFVNTVEAGQGFIHSPGHNTRTIARADDRAEDVGYARALQASDLRGQRTAYETELQEVHQAYLSSEAQNRALLAPLEILETHVSRMEWQRQSNEDLAVTQMMCIHALEARARTDTVEDASSSWTKGIVGLSQWIEKMESVFHIRDCANDNQVKFATCTLLGATLTWWNGHVGTLGHDAAYVMTWGTLKKKMTDKYCPKALMCTKFLVGETEKADKYISGLLDNIYGNVMSAKPKTLDETSKLANDLIDQKLRTYAKRQNKNKRKTDDSLRNNQQQPYKKLNVARAYTVGPGEKKVLLGTYLCAPSEITIC
nr:hypothetical protein [Tanacetum cinerariifolium]